VQGGDRLQAQIRAKRAGERPRVLEIDRRMPLIFIEKEIFEGKRRRKGEGGREKYDVL
jgi:hypothetical protein